MAQHTKQRAILATAQLDACASVATPVHSLPPMRFEKIWIEQCRATRVELLESVERGEWKSAKGGKRERTPVLPLRDGHVPQGSTAEHPVARRCRNPERPKCLSALS